MKTIAIYPGSFNPFTVGHKNIVEKAESIFGKGNVIVALGINPEKLSLDQISSDVLEEKCRVLSDKISRPVQYYIGFLHDYVSFLEQDGTNVVIIRGLRNGEDLDYEVNQIRFMDDFKKGKKLNFCFLMCDKEFEHISSSSIRTIQKFGGDVKKYVV